MNFKYRITCLASSSALALLASQAALATEFNVPDGDLRAALDSYKAQSGISLFVLTDSVKGVHTAGVKGELPDDQALSRILHGTGFITHRDPSGVIAIVREQPSQQIDSITPMQLAQAVSPPRSAVETVTVTSSKLGGADVQSIPIAITALSQEQLTSTQTAGGPDLVKQVPNLTFTKTNFTGYSIQIRGIGTQAISVTTDPAVAIALNDIPFIRNHFFEQEFYDLGQAEILRGPQGTLYGRNATAGVVNLITAKPTDQFEAMASADIGNYKNRRFEGMINLPIVDDRVDLRIAGEWTKRDGYSFNELTNSPIDGRDLWSTRVTLGLHPIEHLQAYFIWEHFQEDDDRLRSSKQLCKTDYGPGGTPTNGTVNIDGVIKMIGPHGYGPDVAGNWFLQGCTPASLYSSDSFEAPLGYAQPYIIGLQAEGNANNINPYPSTKQSLNLRVIASDLNPTYRAKNDTLEFNADYDLTPALTLTSATGYNNDFLWSTEDYNRFGAAPGLFPYNGQNGQPDSRGTLPDPAAGTNGIPDNAGILCDPQLGCSDRLMLADLSTDRAWQLSQEFRVASKFSGPLNFSAGANYLHYETLEKYYVFGNVLTDIDGAFHPGEADSNTNCALPYGFQFNPLNQSPRIACGYVDPNPLSSLDNNGHNYFLSNNPYTLNSYAAFGELNYDVTDSLKLTGGLRWTDDRKHFVIIPSWLVESGWGYPVAGIVDQSWSEWTGRAVANWTPKLDFTDQTLIYSSFSHGYKAGGANPPGAIFSSLFNTPGALANPQATHPLTFKPEFINAYEVGTKNTLLDGALTFNGDVFFYAYKDYQISEIVDRTAINLNFNATVKGAEVESTWEPIPGLKFHFAGGYEDTRIDNGQSAVDLMDRTAGHSDWYVVKPFVNEASNCIFPGYVAKYMLTGSPSISGSATSYCTIAYNLHLDPITLLPYAANPTTYNQPVGGAMLPPGYIGFDPSTAPNDGAGFSKNLGGNQLPNAPHFTTSLAAEYTMPITEEWAATLHGDFYWQSQSYWRVFNDLSYDKLNGYSNVNLSLILTDTSGWQVMGYVKNIFDKTAITGAFLNSDDSGLTTNVFLTDPRLYGVRVTKNW